MLTRNHDGSVGRGLGYRLTIRSSIPNRGKYVFLFAKALKEALGTTAGCISGGKTVGA
jgi:hypothetical protein